jgi:O-acetylhomoserine/O-acetylserine sulfhydrylase-like pyridoxal-dependent enzyme
MSDASSKFDPPQVRPPESDLTRLLHADRRAGTEHGSCAPAAAHLGDVRSPVRGSAPCSASSCRTARTGPEKRAAMGISEGLIRLSVGIEAVHDLLADLEQALGPPDKP